ncbi:ribonuclease T2 family [Nautilia profundicola AmH]|uniref:Ribonuclease T2 family n=1 Tax=Nautilia profundicola (strain ATCC BAA-1463 / DSM 18972 / AmH) TaxID=598659 RepID=B9L804_NAUPA|nr:ribonuclease T [Nautilia profundicola]ACM92910.1 ribonuclease T2 family [Nautilia profundicola AmH]
MKKILFALMFPLMLLAVSNENILALTWLNGFCKANPKKAVCINRKPGDYSLTHFTLHGLWPKKKTFCSNEPLKLSKNFMRILEKYMPAAKYGLAKHEWKKHGTCFGTDPETYFITGIKFTQQFNETMLLQFFRMHMGQSVSLKRMRWMFSQVFGPGNARKFQMLCKNGFITEIRINLKGDPINGDFYELVNNADEFKGVKQCQVGIIAAP